MTKFITITLVLLFGTAINLSAQAPKLKKVKKEETEAVKDKAPIKVNKTAELSEEDKEDIAKAKANASKGQSSDTFKKKKAKIDKARAKVAQLKAKFKAKLASGEWSQEKFDKMMDKITVKEGKIAQKRSELVNSLMSK